MEDEEMEDIHETHDAIALSLRDLRHEPSGDAGQDPSQPYSPAILRNDNPEVNAASSPDDTVETMQIGSPPVSSTLATAAAAGSSQQAPFTSGAPQGLLQQHLSRHFHYATKVFISHAMRARLP